MLAEWGDAGQDHIRLSLWIDYGFMLVYGAFLCLAGAGDPRLRQGARDAGAGRGGQLGALVRRRRGALRRARERQPAADLGGHGGSVSPPLATACASVKFVLIVLAIVYVLWGWSPGSGVGVATRAA